jgi:hypothetical protein
MKVPLLAARRGLIVNITSDAASGMPAGVRTVPASRRWASDADPGNGTARPVSAVLVDPEMRTRMHQEAFPQEDISIARCPM